MQGTRSRLLTFVLVLALAAGAVSATAGRVSAEAQRAPVSDALQARVLHAKIDAFRTETWYWQRLMGVPYTPYANSARTVQSLDYTRWVHDLWKKRAASARRKGRHPPRLAAWQCIHRYESAGYGWSVNTGNGYYGGLQMDLEFQRTYGGFLLRKKGTADHWTALEQIWVAERAYRKGLGFAPWPNTARYCGLI